MCQNHQCFLCWISLDFLEGIDLLSLLSTMTPPSHLPSMGPLYFYFPPHTKHSLRYWPQVSTLPLIPFPIHFTQVFGFRGNQGHPADDSLHPSSAQISMSTGLLDLPTWIAQKHLRLNIYRESSSSLVLNLKFLL